jgi:hypothetical protein
MKRRSLILSLFLIALLVSTTAAQKVSVDYDRNADFPTYRTYAFIESKNPASSRLWCERILDNIQLKLAVKRLLPARAGESVDLFIVYNAGIREQTAIEGYNYNYGQAGVGVGMTLIHKCTQFWSRGIPSCLI